MSRSCVIVGGSGALGRALVTRFARAGWGVTSVDFVANEDAASNVELARSGDFPSRVRFASEACDGGEFDAVISAAGGWSGTTPDAEDFAAVCASMWQLNVESAVLATHLACRFLRPAEGMLTLTGAAAALAPTPGFNTAYGISKSATHQLLSSVSAEGGGLPEGCVANAVLPATIDTPANRDAMPDADFAEWTPPVAIADHVLDWAADAALRPASGALVRVVTEGGATRFEV
mgnify:CR=1 FL=1